MCCTQIGIAKKIICIQNMELLRLFLEIKQKGKPKSMLSCYFFLIQAYNQNLWLLCSYTWQRFLSPRHLSFCRSNSLPMNSGPLFLMQVGKMHCLCFCLWVDFFCKFIHGTCLFWLVWLKIPSKMKVKKTLCPIIWTIYIVVNIQMLHYPLNTI